LRTWKGWVVGVAIGVVLAVVIAFGATNLGSASAAPSDAPATVQVVGTGEVSGAPDTLTLQLGVSTNASSAVAALSKNDAEMARLQSMLEHAGVPVRDLATSDLELSPNYDPSGTITGYGVDDDLVVTMTDLRDAGTAIDAAADAVGNDVQINGLSFSLSNSSALLQAARTVAMRDAHRAALALASASGDRLGPVEKITDNEQVSAPPSPLPEFAASAAHAAAVPVRAGSEQINDQVTVVYELEA
jgi:uncharacterized protein YggE